MKKRAVHAQASKTIKNRYFGRNSEFIGTFGSGHFGQSGLGALWHPWPEGLQSSCTELLNCHKSGEKHNVFETGSLKTQENTMCLTTFAVCWG